MISNSNNYPAWFEEFWKRCLPVKTRSLGGRFEAYTEAKKLKMGPEDVEHLVQCFKNHTDNIRLNPRSVAPHKDMCRWLKYRWFENEICESVSGTGIEALPRSDQRKAEAAERYRLKHMGNGVAPSGGHETNVGGTGQHDLRVLESKS